MGLFQNNNIGPEVVVTNKMKTLGPYIKTKGLNLIFLSSTPLSSFGPVLQLLSPSSTMYFSSLPWLSAPTSLAGTSRAPAPWMASEVCSSCSPLVDSTLTRGVWWNYLSATTGLRDHHQSFICPHQTVCPPLSKHSYVMERIGLVCFWDAAIIVAVC